MHRSTRLLSSANSRRGRLPNIQGANTKARGANGFSATRYRWTLAMDPFRTLLLTAIAVVGIGGSANAGELHSVIELAQAKMPGGNSGVQDIVPGATVSPNSDAGTAGAPSNGAGTAGAPANGAGTAGAPSNNAGTAGAPSGSAAGPAQSRPAPAGAIPGTPIGAAPGGTSMPPPPSSSVGTTGPPSSSIGTAGPPSSSIGSTGAPDTQ